MNRWTVEAVGEVSYEDSGQACIVEVNPDDGQDNGVFVRVLSWVEQGSKEDHEIAALGGKRVRVEITVLED